MASCPTLATGDAFLSTLLLHIDCQAQTIGTTGYRALADPGSSFSLALTALLTIFIALFGVRMVLGETPSLRDGVLAIIKIGIVLLIATSWPAYRTVVYDVIVHGPGQLSAAIGAPSGLPGANGDLIERLQTSDEAITRLTTLGSGRNDLSSAPSAPGSRPAQTVERAPIADDLAFGSARVLFLSSVVAAFAVIRLGAGVLLALAPLFAGLLLFDMSRGLFVGWARALLFTMLSSVAVTMLLGVQLALLEPWLTQTLTLRHAKVMVPAAPVELLVICLAFAPALAGSIWMTLRLAFALHIPLTIRAASEPQPSLDRSPPRARVQEMADMDGRSPRALAVARAVATAQRRESAHRVARPSGLLAGRSAAASRMSPEVGGGLSISSSGRLSGRRRPRKSLSAGLRDRSS